MYILLDYKYLLNSFFNILNIMVLLSVILLIKDIIFNK